jgi:hypothetical protein
MSTEHEDFSDSKPLTPETQSPGSKRFEELAKQQSVENKKSCKGERNVN